MKYYLKFEGREKLVIKIVLILLLIIVCLLTKIAFTEESIYVDFGDEQLESLCLSD